MRIIFIDVDGTLIDSAGIVPESAKNAIRAARDNGHLVFINTGRSRAQVFPYIEEIGFDGYICSDGNYVEYKEEILKKESLNKHQIDIINDYLKKNKLGFMAEGHKDFLVNEIFLEQTRALIGEGNMERFKTVFPHSGLVEKVPYDDIGKVNFPSTVNISEQLAKELGPELTVSFFSSDISSAGMISMYVPGSDKMNGVKFILDYLNQKDAKTYAFGDTSGDLGMVKGCTYGICVGNGEQILKDHADYVTDSVNEDGLFKAFKKYGLID